MLTRHGAWTRLEMRLPESAYAPRGFAAGDNNLYRYVGNAPTNATDPSGLVDDELYEGVLGITPAIREGTLQINRPLYQSFVSKDFIKGTQSRVAFSFSRSFIGSWKIPTDAGPRSGLYVKIEAFLIGANVPKYEKLRIIQVVRIFKIAPDGKNETVREFADVGEKLTDLRGGWSEKNAPSKGWMVDVAATSTSPYYGIEGLTRQTGSSTDPKEPRNAIIYDGPSVPDKMKNIGSEFITLLVGLNAGKKGAVLGYVRWGYYRDSDGNVSSLQFKGNRIGTDFPQEAKDAIKRWNGIKGNEDAGVDLD